MLRLIVVTAIVLIEEFPSSALILISISLLTLREVQIVRMLSHTFKSLTQIDIGVDQAILHCTIISLNRLVVRICCFRSTTRSRVIGHALVVQQFLVVSEVPGAFSDAEVELGVGLLVGVWIFYRTVGAV